FSPDARPATARWPHYQQWIDLGLCSPAQRGVLYGHQACHHRADQSHLAGWPQIRYCLRPDRYRQCRQRHDRGHEPRRLAGGRVDAPGTPYGCGARCPGRTVYGEPAAGRQCSVHDGDGDQDALYRARLDAGHCQTGSGPISCQARDIDHTARRGYGAIGTVSAYSDTTIQQEYPNRWPKAAWEQSPAGNIHHAPADIMTFPAFFNAIPAIIMQDPLAQLLGAADAGLIEYTYADTVKLAGHSCPTVAGAYL